MKMLVDMNLSPRWVGLLADARIEAAHWSTIGSPKAPDSEIMAYASVNDYVVLTHDLDFSTILAVTHVEKPSVVQIRADNLSLDAIGELVVSAIRQMRAELDEGALITSIQAAHACAYCLCCQEVDAPWMGSKRTSVPGSLFAATNHSGFPLGRLWSTRYSPCSRFQPAVP